MADHSCNFAHLFVNFKQKYQHGLHGTIQLSTTIFSKEVQHGAKFHHFSIVTFYSQSFTIFKNIRNKVLKGKFYWHK